MSKSNAKTQPAPQADAPAAGLAAAVVQPTPPAASADAYHGRGGLYTVQGGHRVPVPATPPATPAMKETP
ncbi:MAG: hypothetical protein JSR53_09485 [Proteobacteria bacterium]|nr:hypothetical protein [Pseudomonadota bacterium]